MGLYMLYAFERSFPPLTTEQITQLQVLEGTLGRLIFYSEHRNSLHHYIYDYQNKSKLYSFNEMCTEINQRIAFVNNYVANAKAKRSYIDDHPHEFRMTTESNGKKPKT